MDEMIEQIKKNLRSKISSLNYNTWFKPIQQGKLDGEIYTLVVPNRFIADWITDYYADLIVQEVQRLLQKEVRLKFEVTPEATDSAAETEKEGKQTQAPAIVTPLYPIRSASCFGLNPKYCFNTFVVGSGNQLAHAAAKAVASLPGRHYNPLFLYGGVGLGKTHLLNAIGLEIVQRNPEFKIIYLSSERFMNDFINGIRYDRMADFRKRFRQDCDMLLVDDIQFIAGKESTQDEFFHTFNSLYDSQRQIIVTSDKSPKEIPGLEDRLRSRFEWGLIADIQAPDLETRIAIIKKKAENTQIHLEEDVSMFLATQIKGNVRELEGALIRLKAFAELAKSPITLELSKNVIQNLFLQRNGHSSTIESIQRMVADFYQIKVADLTSERRMKSFAHPRQVAMYLCRKYLKRSFPEIGHGFGDKDHTTVMHAVKRIEKFLLSDTKLRDDIEYLEKVLLN